MASYDTAREILIRAFPNEVFRPQPSDDWQGEFPLPDPVAEYFAELGPVDAWIPGYGNPYFLLSRSLGSGAFRLATGTTQTHIGPSQTGTTIGLS